MGLKWLLAVGSLAFLGCSTEEPIMEASPSSQEQFKRDLAEIRQARIFFGHQSVGKSILDELKAAASEGLPEVTILPLGSTDSLPEAFIADKMIGSNNSPESKIEDFTAAVAAASGKLDVAMMKLCYIDFGPDTDAKALFESYRGAVEEVRAAHPDLLIVHATAPLVTVDKFRTLIKKLMGKKTAEDANMRRQEYNELLVSAFPEDPIFDLAALESTRPDGSRVSFTRDGKTYYCLAEAYTTDGGHLNARGARLAAMEFARVLADEIRKRRNS